MAYRVTGSDLYEEIALHLIETPTDGSAEPTTGLWTRAAIMARINQRAKEFNRRARNFIKNKIDVAVTADNKVVDMPADTIDILDLAYESPTNGFTTVPEESVYMEDLLDFEQFTPVDTPHVYVYEESPRLQLSLMPPPDANSFARFHYTSVPTNLPSPPDMTILEISDDLTPFIKYGALADLFGKSGETYDPLRKQVCEELFELGVEAAQSFVRGSE